MTAQQHMPEWPVEAATRATCRATNDEPPVQFRFLGLPWKLESRTPSFAFTVQEAVRATVLNTGELL